MKSSETGSAQEIEAAKPARATSASAADPQGYLSSDEIFDECDGIPGENAWMAPPPGMPGPGVVVMLGETYGTVEMPRMMLAMACIGFMAGYEVRVGLEIPESEQFALTRYLHSDGTDADRAELLASPHWNRDDQDGRSSQAMLDLIEKLRWFRQRGRLSIEIFAFDVSEKMSANEREAHMARTILAHAAPDSDNIVVMTLSGKVQSRTIAQVPGHPELVPMGFHVKEGAKEVFSIEFRHAGGTAWTCQSSRRCGPVQLEGDAKYGRIVLSVNESTREPGMDGYLSVGTITASPPAVQSAASR